MLIFRLLATVVLLAVPVCALAAPETTAPDFTPSNVTLYPSSAKIKVKTNAAPHTLPSGETVILTYLPGFADPQTLTADIGAPLAAIKTKRLAQDDYNDPIRAPWQARVEAATTARNAVQSEVNTAKAIVDMWSKATAPASNLAAELTKMDSAMQKNLVAANIKLLDLEMKLAEAERLLGIAQQAFDALAPSFEVAFVLASPENQTSASSRNITYAYTLNNCGWQPVYTLNAQPEKQSIAFGFAAKINQNSGLNWQNTELSLATNAPSWFIAPPAVENWHIGSLPKPAPTAIQQDAAPMQAKLAAPRAKLMGNAPEVPVETVFANYSTWNMGNKNIPSNEEVICEVMAEDLKASFNYIARPASSDQAFLAASLAEDSPTRILPKAQTVFMVDGNTAGTGIYPPDAGQSVFFGPDPLLAVKSVELTNQAGESGFIGKTQTRKWAWKIEIKNNHKQDIDLRVEEPMPNLLNTEITLKLASNPMPTPEADKHMYVWNKKLTSGETFIIDHVVEASAPGDVPLESSK